MKSFAGESPKEREENENSEEQEARKLKIIIMKNMWKCLNT
jgi:hypothetical protein